MVNRDDQDVFGTGCVGDGEQAGPQRHRGRHIESHGDESGHRRDRLVASQRLRLQMRHGRLGDRQHPLHRTGFGARVHRAQHLVPGDDIGQGQVQRGDVEIPAQPDGQRDRIGRGLLVHPVEQPHALLCRRQWRRFVGAPWHQRGARRTTQRGGPRQRGDGGMTEHSTHRDGGAEGGPEPGRHLGGGQGIAAQGEEVVVRTDAVGARQPEHVGDDPGDGALRRGARRPELGDPEYRFGQCLPIQLPGRAERDAVDHHDRGGHHVGGQTPGGVGGELVHIDGVARLGHHIGDQCRFSCTVTVGDGGGEGDRTVRAQHRVDLPEFDAQSADLDLMIGAPDVFDHVLAVAPAPAHQVTGAVQPPTGVTERIGDEPPGGQAWATLVSAAQARSAQIQLTRDARRYGLQPVVEHHRRDALDRCAHVEAVTGPFGRAGRGDDRGLGGSVTVVEFAVRAPAGRQLRVVELTAHPQTPQLRERGGVQRA